MIGRIGEFFRRHPALRETLVWSLPALAFGALLRLMLLSYSPYAYWGSDSRSFFGFTDGVLGEFYFSINEKRRYFYPLFLFPVALLPGPVLTWLAWIQAGLGLATVGAFAYVVRRVFVGWRWLIVPATLLYAGLPVFIWYEHELIADTLFFDALVWAMAGWAAWVSQADPGRARGLWWWYLAPLAIFMLTKPAGKFFWPGVVLALVAVCAWRVPRWKQWAALAVVFLAGMTVGDDDQSAWLLYTTAFPLTQVDSSLHTEYKAEIRDLVERKRARLFLYDEEDGVVHDFLRSPEDHSERPKWQALAKDEEALAEVYRDLAMEGIRARPDLFLMIGLQRLVGSCNLGDFKDERFETGYFAERFRDQYERKRNPERMLRVAFGLGREGPLPPFEWFQERINPRPDSGLAEWLMRYVRSIQNSGQLVVRPTDAEPLLTECRLTVLGWWVVIGAGLSLLPWFFRRVGVWTVTLAMYLVAVFLVGVEHTRYFAPAWPVVILLLAVPIDAVIRVVLRKRDFGSGGRWLR
jgi:hypothetical protein